MFSGVEALFFWGGVSAAVFPAFSTLCGHAKTRDCDLVGESGIGRVLFTVQQGPNNQSITQSIINTMEKNK